MKGISPIIAIIIILLITIAIAGSAYAYISIVWGGMVTEAIQITGQSCSGDQATIYVKNIGTGVLAAADFTVERDGTTLTITTDYTIDATIAQGVVGTIKETATGSNCDADNYCKYTLIVGGRVYRTDIQC